MVRAKREKDKTTELLQDLIIVYLGSQGVNYHTIRKLARCELRRVTDVLRLAGVSMHTDNS